MSANFLLFPGVGNTRHQKQASFRRGVFPLRAFRIKLNVSCRSRFLYCASVGRLFFPAGYVLNMKHPENEAAQ